MPTAAPQLSKLPLDEARRVLAMMAVQAQEERTQLQAHPYPTPELRGDARIMWDSTDREQVLSGPAETGKTFACLHKLNYLATMYPGMQGAIVRKTYASMHGSVLQTYRRILGRDTPVHAYGGEKPEWFDYPNGSRVFIGGMDNPQKVLSSERDIIYINQAEELTLDDWETLTTRATGRGSVMPYTQIYGDCNPGPATHWILSRESMRRLHSKHEDNPTLFTPTGEITEQGRRTMQVLDALTGSRYKRLRLGLWVGAEGMVYEGWDASTHHVDLEYLRQCGLLEAEQRANPLNLLTIRPARVNEVYGAIDWGFTNPCVIQAWVQDKDGRLYMVAENYRTQMLIEDVIGVALQFQRHFGIRAFYADPSEPAYIKQAREAGLRIREANNDVHDGIQAVQARLPVPQDGKPRMALYRAARFHDPDPLLEDKHKPTCTAEEFDSYVWAKVQSTDTTKEDPRKQDDHGLDALRYCVIGVDGKKPGAPVFSW